MGKIQWSQLLIRIFFLLLFFGLISIGFIVSDWDISLQKLFYDPVQGWYLKFHPFWDWMYRYGIFPGYVFAFGALVFISASYWNEKYIKYRKAALLMVFTLAFGPGLLVNATFKDHWGRPRPREVVEFGGQEKFHCFCEKGVKTGGKSFPCGHCSMGFYMAIPFLFLYSRRKLLAFIFLIVGSLYGLLIGIARMMAGGHFASDVLWSAGIVWFVAILGFYLFRVDQPIEIKPISNLERKRKAKISTWTIGILIPLMTIGLLLATPYLSKKELKVGSSKFQDWETRFLIADLKNATVILTPDTFMRAAYEVNAFGFPNSKVRARWSTGDTCSYRIQHMGWFTEVRNSISLTLPDRLGVKNEVRMSNGKIILSSRWNNGIKIVCESCEITLKQDQFSDTIFLVYDTMMVKADPLPKPFKWINPGDKLPLGAIQLEAKEGQIRFEN